MGLISYLKKMKTSQKEVKILVLGLDNAGKTTILKAIADENIKSVKPTEGFNIKNFSLDGISLSVWDLGGQKVLREYWSNYFDHTDALIYVVDAADEARLNEAGAELQKLLSEKALDKVPILVYANKQDLVHSLGADVVTTSLRLDAIKERKWMIVACSAKSKEGLVEGLEWVVSNFKRSA